MTTHTAYPRELRTRRLVLRKFRHADVDDIWKNIADIRVVGMLARPPFPYERTDAIQFVERVAVLESDEREFVRAITRDDTVIGTIGIETVQPVPILGYWLGVDFWGKGYMSEAVGAMATAFFNVGANDRLNSGYFEGNTASWRIQQKIGFVETGRDLVYCRARNQKLLHVFTKLDEERYRENCP